MAYRPVVNSLEILTNWMNEGKTQKKDVIFRIKPIGDKGRPGVADWICIASPAHIPSGRRYALSRSSDHKEIEVLLQLSLPSQGIDEDEEPGDDEEGLIDGQIVPKDQASADALLANTIGQAAAIQEISATALSNSQRANKLASESISDMERCHKLMTEVKTEDSKTVFYRSMSLLAHRALGIIGERMSKFDGVAERSEYHKFQRVKAALVAEAGVDLGQIPTAELAALLRLREDPMVAAAMSEMIKRDLENLSGAISQEE